MSRMAWLFGCESVIDGGIEEFKCCGRNLGVSLDAKTSCWNVTPRFWRRAAFIFGDNGLSVCFPDLANHDRQKKN